MREKDALHTAEQQTDAAPPLAVGRDQFRKGLRRGDLRKKSLHGPEPGWKQFRNTQTPHHPLKSDLLIQSQR